jgi:hypothetical protein
VLGDVRQRLRDDVIGRDLDRLAKPLVCRDVERNGDRRTTGERPQGRAEASIGDSILSPLTRPAESLARVAWLGPPAAGSDRPVAGLETKSTTAPVGISLPDN